MFTRCPPENQPSDIERTLKDKLKPLGLHKVRAKPWFAISREEGRFRHGL